MLKCFQQGKQIKEGSMDFEIIRTSRKTVSINIKSGKVILRGPYSLSDEKAEKIIKKHEAWILSKLEISKEKADSKIELSEEKIKRLREEAKTYFKKETEKFSKIMNLKCGRITITGAKTRFGSCSSKGNICFSYLLMLYPETAREYVVVHELAHLIEMNHSKRFYQIVEKYLPDYKERKKQLRDRM